MLRIEVTHLIKFDLPPGLATGADLNALEKKLMSALSDAIDKLNTSVDAAVLRVTTDVNSLKAQIAALQATATTPADLQAIADLQAKVDASLDPTMPPA